ncbi:MAG: hypothetical protein GTO14_03285 [Anaerolineales bacterium]|nr:hypothetical protein [Anaerolineales bacterium]
MGRQVTDDDIRTFLRLNWNKYSSQMELMQQAIKLLWPAGPPEDGSKRVVTMCLTEFHTLSAPGLQKVSVPAPIVPRKSTEPLY